MLPKTQGGSKSPPAGPPLWGGDFWSSGGEQHGTFFSQKIDDSPPHSGGGFWSQGGSRSGVHLGRFGDTSDPKMILVDIKINAAIFRCKTVFSTECENTKLTNTMQIFGLRPARLHDHFIYYKIVTI